MNYANSKNNIYDFLTDDNGKEVAVNRITGEILQLVETNVPEKSLIFTQADIEAYREKMERIKKAKEKKAEYERQQALRRKKEPFYFCNHNENFEDVKPSSVAKLVYLLTYLNYDNVLMKTQIKKITYQDLPKILNVHPDTVNSFWKEVCPEYITVTDKGIQANPDIFHRGALKNKSVILMFNNNIRSLYEKSKITSHKHLGYIFKMLPYINYEWNTLCYNPSEKDKEKLRTEAITILEFCDLIGYDKTKYKRLMNTYNEITFNINGSQQKFCAFVVQGTNLDDSHIIINPNILYSGTDKNKVEAYGIFC